MKKLLLVFTAIAICRCAKAQDTTSLKAALCRFEAPRVDRGPEYGTGFVIAQQADTLYLVTAGHVLRERAPGKPVLAWIGEKPDTLKAEVVLYHDPEVDGREDLAVCKVICSAVSVPKLKVLPQLTIKNPVFYYNNVALNPQTGGGEQNLTTWDDERHIYRINLPDIVGGDSGGPVFTLSQTPELTGIILAGTDACEVLKISKILQIITKELPNLAEKLNLEHEKTATTAPIAAN